MEQALYERQPAQQDGLNHHTDRGVQYVSNRNTDRLVEVDIEPSVGSVGDSCDNPLAETINVLYKGGVIHRLGPWRNPQAGEMTTLEWVGWFNNRRLFGPIGNNLPVKAEAAYYPKLAGSAIGGVSQAKRSPEIPGRFIAQGTQRPVQSHLDLSLMDL